MSKYDDLGKEIGALVTSKQRQYGDSAGRSGRILEVLYPNGLKPHQYDDALLVIRCLDKFSRIAQRGEDGQDLGGESPYFDLGGYAILGLHKDRERKKSASKPMCAGCSHTAGHAPGCRYELGVVTYVDAD
jgi:hypothetical protein